MKTNPATSCICNKCGAHAPSAIAGKAHRRCGGQKGAPLRGPGNRLPGNEKGEWEEGQPAEEKLEEALSE